MKKLLLALVIVALVLPAALTAFADTIYIVQPGDTLFSISRRFNVSQTTLMAANGISNPNLIYAGQRLVIPSSSATSTPLPPPPGLTPTPPAGGSVIHIVHSGDTLFSIAVRYNVTMAAIIAANGIVNPNLIYVGQPLTIPQSGGTPAPTSTPAPGPTVTPNPTTPPTGGTYTVRSGDTLWAISQRFGTSVTALMNANHLTSTVIYVGQVLVIPGSSSGGGTPPPPSSGFALGGQVEAFTAPDRMTQAGMTWVKRQVRWVPGATADGAWIIDAHGRGFKILLSVLGRPSDVAGSANFDAYATYVGELARLGADAIEVWNEQNIDREWPTGQINPATYTDLLRRAYTQIKAKNPNTLVISGALAPTGAEGAFGTDRVWNDDRYLGGMAAAGAANYLDCVGVHYNEGIVSPTQNTGDPRDNYYTRYYAGMVTTYYNAFGGTRPLCFTELGYLTGEGYAPLPAAFAWAATTSLAEHAQWLGEATTLSRTNGKVRLMIVFNVDLTIYGEDPQAGYAILRPGNACPACDTLRAAMGGR